ncbi:hypothetical protein HD554DRAFT_2177651 [Boletus coccyginus]|nr:hypothetical protein HD554DRAFT_2177651 [Boletus coccyginus]
MPVVPNGTYKILSVKYSPPNVDKPDEQVADLIHNGPGPIAGRPDSQVHNDQWRITNKYDLPTSNSVLIESVRTPGIYAYANPGDGAPVLGEPAGSTEAIIWTLVNRGGKFNIQYPSPHDNLLWELKEPNQNIKLGDYQDGTKPYNEWLFVPV